MPKRTTVGTEDPYGEAFDGLSDEDLGVDTEGLVEKGEGDGEALNQFEDPEGFMDAVGEGLSYSNTPEDSRDLGKPDEWTEEEVAALEPNAHKRGTPSTEDGDGEESRETVTKSASAAETYEEGLKNLSDVEDPDALLEWLEEQDHEILNGWDPEEDTLEDLVEALEDADAEKLLQDLTVTYVSGVSDPAQDSRWIMAKDTDARGADWGVTAPLVVKDADALDAEDGEEEQKAWAPVLIPNETDKQGDVIPSGEIEQAAHEFLANFRKIDTDHDLMEGKGVPIESWTLKRAQTLTLPNGEESREYPAGTWMLGVQFNDEAWSRVKSGDLQGFSIYGEAENVPVPEILGLEDGSVESSGLVEFSKSDDGEDTEEPGETAVDSWVAGTEKALTELEALEAQLA